MNIHRMVFLCLLLSLGILLVSNSTTIAFDMSQNTPERNFVLSYTPHDAIWIQSNEEFHTQADIEDWPGEGTELSPYIITGYSFNQDTQPLRIWNTDVYWIFTGNLVDGIAPDVLCGTWIQDVSNGVITNNEFRNRHSGIAIIDVTDMVISNNYVHDCFGNGLEFTGGVVRSIIEGNSISNIGQNGIYSSASINCTISGNIVSTIDDIGIALMGVSPNCNITGNTVDSCGSSGIIVSILSNGYIVDNIVSNTELQGINSSGASSSIISGNCISEIDGIGIKLQYTESSIIMENIVTDCTKEGFLVNSGEESEIHWNYFENTSEFAVKLDSSSTNITVKFNTFIDCGSTCLVFDDGTTNVISHNYYSSWHSPDADLDGFVDSPYSIDGAASNEDAFPLAIAGVVPTTNGGTTPTGDNQSFPMDLFLVGSAALIFVVVSAVFFIKRK